MKYTDLSINLGFHKNMQETNWLKLFPKWWAENDPLIEAIGKEIAYIKAESIFSLLNTALKPPVMIWQESLNHETYTESFTINKNKDENENHLTELVKLPAPLYKTYGTIDIKNNTIDDITNFKISLNDNDYIVILDTIHTNDFITINVGSQKIYINDNEANIIIHGDGFSYFKTGQNKKEYVPNVETEIKEDVLSYTVKVPKDFTGKIGLTNNKTGVELYDDYFYDEEEIVLEDEYIKREFLVANEYPNNQDISKTPKIDIRLHSDPLYFNTFIQAPTNEYKIYNTPKPLHNEAINLFFDFNDITNVNMDIDVILNNAVFINEQNIEVHGFELIPIESVNLYAYYDFPYNLISTGWRKVYEKEYDPKTEVIYDMITTHFYTKKFYVEVFFKGIDYPYQVGFPCEKNAEEDSMYHINDNLDAWGEYFGLKRRDYKTNIPDEDYPFTYPPFYPFDIEQDYWYYQRLINEYATNDLAIDKIDLLDTNEDPIVRLHSIDPFIQDFVVYANSRYPMEKENVDYNIFIPNYVNQDIIEAEYKRMSYYDTHNLLRYDNNKANITLLNKAGTNITTQRYLSKPLRTFFDLTSLPEDININDITVLIEAESTDNSIDKYSNSETGIIIPGISEDKVFKMQQSDNYELEEKEIEYHLLDTFETITKQYGSIDTNVIQIGTIKPFGGKQNTYMSIPFVLRENDEIIDDITEVYVTYKDYGTYKGTYHNENIRKTHDGQYIEIDEEKKRYIYVHIPKIIPDNAIYNIKEYISKNNEKNISYIIKDDKPYELVQEVMVTISCKTKNHNSFTSKEFPLKVRVTTETEKEIEDKELEFLEVTGPYVNNALKILHIESEWHTGDLRNILQKDGIYFINTFENDNTTNTPVILIKNIRLKINYSPKKSKFKLETSLHKKGVNSPTIAKLDVKITNIGDTDLISNIDIISATNLKLSQNYINVNLGVNESTTTTIDIIPEFPILDGQYEILTICEDKICKNNVLISSNGLAKTSVDLKRTYGQYNEPLTLKASVKTVDNAIIDDEISKIAFYINDFKVGESSVYNNEAEIIITPNTFNFLSAGFHSLEARYSGNEKYASSKTTTSLLLSQNNTNIDLLVDDTIIYGQQYTIQTNITDDNQNLINEGTVSFYIDEDKIGTTSVMNGIASISTSFENVQGKHNIIAVYNGTSIYAQDKKEKEINIIGGDVIINVFNITAKPNDDILLKARITDTNNSPLSIGQVIFTITKDEETIYTSELINIKKGLSQCSYTLNNNIFKLNNDNATQEYNIIVDYFDTEEYIYQDNSNSGTLTIKKGSVIIDDINFSFGSQYEPLGFYATVRDSVTNKPITYGQVDIIIPELNIISENNNVDSDGGIRVIYNPVSISADDFDRLLNFYFTLGKTLPYTNNDNEIVQLYTLNDEEQQSFEDENLYCIYDGSKTDLNLLNFSIDQNNHLLYHKTNANNEEEAEEIFISEEGHLYARSSIELSQSGYYPIGIFSMQTNYLSNEQYKNTTKESKIKITPSNYNVDIHSQTITYSDQNKNIECYVTSKNSSKKVNNGTVYFFIDNQEIGTGEVIDNVATLSSNDINAIKHGHHILTVEYITENQPSIYSHTILNVEPIISSIQYDFIHDKIVHGQKSNINVAVNISDIYDTDITGDVKIFVDDTLMASNNITTSERKNNMIVAELNFTIDIPLDLKTEEHLLTIEYSGNDFILPSSETITLEEQLLPISINTKDVYVAAGEQCSITYDINTIDNSIINNGEIILYQGSNNIITKNNIKNNKVTLTWTVDDILGETPYILEYNGNEFLNSDEPIIQNIIIIEPQNDVYIVQDQNEDIYEYSFDNLQEASQCVVNGGNIHIIDYVNIDNNITINKDVNIIGHNDAAIYKNLPDLLINENNIKIYEYDDFDTEIYEISGLKIENLNSKDFYIINSDLYFVNNDNIIPLFLFDNNIFYSYVQISLSEIINSISLNFNGVTNINNINFKSLDNDIGNQFNIITKERTSITKSIINSNIVIDHKKFLNINESAIYGNIIGSNEYDLDNNWWGTNNKPNYNVHNQIILKMWSETTPPIIGEDIHIVAKLIGENNITYDLPILEYYFEAESGEFSITNGFTFNNTIYTTYYDSGKKCTIYCTVDNQTISLDVLDYYYKTEVLLDNINEIPIDYQITLTAKVQSMADTYYKFDNNSVIETDKIINDGYIIFYLDNRQIGTVNVVNGEANIPIYLATQQYPIIQLGVDQYNINIKAEYHSNNEYLPSQTEKEVTLIDTNKVCFVSSDVQNNGTGTYSNPFNSIQEAVLQNKERIYLKPGIYLDEEINIVGTQDIRAYNGQCIFKDNTNNIMISNDDNSFLSLYRLTFENNNSSFIISDINDVNVYQCIFYNNNCTESLIDYSNNVNIEYSVIIDNKCDILNLYDNNEQIKYCWFGSNNPNDNLFITGEITDYVVMTLESSRKIYIGSVAYLIASLKYYNHNDILVPLEKDLPLRTSRFYTNIGSVMPIIDYTHNNESISFLNTNEESNTYQILLTTPQNDNYINNQLVLECKVQDVYGNAIDTGSVSFKFRYNDENIILNGDVVNGIAKVRYDTPLNIGEYELQCVYNNYTHVSSFKVLKPQLIIDNLNILDDDHVYNMFLEATFSDSLKQKYIDQRIKIYIDDIFIKEDQIINNVLNTELYYDNLDIGTHILTITTKDLDSDYDIFTKNYEFTVNKKDTYIDFKYTGLAINEPTNLIIKVYDKNNRLVDNGTINIKYDNEDVCIDSTSTYAPTSTNNNIILNNGIGVVYGFYSDIGQHSIVIKYNGHNTLYNDSLYVNNIFNVGLYEVNIESEELKEQNSFNLGQEFNLVFPIKDQFGNLVSKGTVNISLDSADTLNDEPLLLTNGYVNFTGQFSPETQSGIHNLIITYNDNSDPQTYLTTTYYHKINIMPIEVQILVNTFYTEPNTTITLDYEVESKYGLVQTGTLIAYYNGDIIGTANVSDLQKTITLHIPTLLPNKQYNIAFKYISNNNIYNNNITTTTMNITKPLVNITALEHNCYINDNIEYGIKITDNNNYNINFGTVELYIDNVKTATQTINDNITYIPLPITNVQEYNITVIYLENDYYEKTTFSDTFNIINVPITNISLVDTTSIPNNQLQTELIFTTNTNNIDVTDGFVDFILNNIKINTFAIQEGNKYVKLDIPNLNVGTYPLTINYYNSKIFENQSFTYDFIIESQDIHMTIPNEYNAVLNDIISITTNIEENIKGTLEYYLVTTNINDNTSNTKFIGINQINNQNNIDFEYRLPANLEQTNNIEYNIIVKFTGNEQYNSIEKTCQLNIQKETPVFTDLIVNDVEYQSILTIESRVNINNNTLIYFYLDTIDNQIGYKATNDTDENGYIIFEYHLKESDTPSSEHKIIAKINESTTIQEVIKEQQFTITKTIPIINDQDIEAYIGTEIQLPSTLIDNKYNQVTTGTLEYKIENDIIATGQPGDIINYQLSNNDINDQNIDIIYTADVDSNYEDFATSVNIIMNKNNIRFYIDTNEPVTRGTTINKELVIISNTTTNFDGIEYTATLEGTIINDLSQIEISNDLPDKEEYILTISFDGNDAFNPRTDTFILKNKNEKNIEVTENIDLATALSLVANGGTINITTNINNENVVNNKNITINGNDYILSACTIENKGILNVTNATFQNSTNSVITNSGKINITNCIFKDNTAQYGAAIYITNRNINTVISKCTFNNNYANLYGGAIFSNKGNDVTITECEFSEQNYAKVKGSSISTNGNMYISNSTFFNNINNNGNGSEIYIINGKNEIENNYFDHNITPIENNGEAICNFNYWGYNDITQVQNIGEIQIDTWLISDYKISYTEPNIGNIHTIITPMINQYQKNDEIIPYQNMKFNVPIYINNEEYSLWDIENNKNTEIDLENENDIQLIIGQEEIIIGE